MTKFTATHNSVRLCDSCKTCSSAKVRCSKEKPSCSRCVARGIDCVYRTSKRTGRPSAQSNADGKLMKNKRRKSSVNPRVDSVTADDERAPSMSSILNEAPDNLSINMSGLVEISTHPRPSFLDAIENDMPDFMTHQPTDDPAWNYLQNDPEEHRCQHESGCLSFALDLLGQSSLADASTTSMRPTTAAKDLPPFTLEAAVSLNKELTGPLTSILNCSCAPNENLLTIVALVISRVLTWCTRAVNNTAPIRSSGSSTSSVSDGEFSPMDLLDFSQTSGPFCISSGGSEVDAQSVIAAETMLDDLYRLKDIIERFSGHVQVVTGRANGTSCSDEVRQSHGAGAQMSTSSDSLLLSDTMAARVHNEFRRRLHVISLKVVQILLRG